MKVYYESSLFCEGKGFGGIPQRTSYKFEYMGTKRYIPYIYHFSEGIVFDIITILDEEKIRGFFEKYEAIEETLTPLQQRYAEGEHPYQTLSTKEIWINREKVENSYSSSSAISIPWYKEDDVLRPIRKAYLSILKDIDCFGCQRFCIPYPKTDSKIQKLLRFLHLDRVKNMKLLTHFAERFYPLDIHFEISMDDGEKEIYFNHPTTQIKHRLYFQKPESVDIPIEARGKQKLYCTQLMYEIEPPLPEGDNLQFDSSIQYTESTDNEFGPTSTSSIGIIGGAVGPTASFIALKREETVPYGLHGLPLYSCFSIPNFQKEDTSQFILEGINIKNYPSKEYNF